MLPPRLLPSILLIGSSVSVVSAFHGCTAQKPRSAHRGTSAIADGRTSPVTLSVANDPISSASEALVQSLAHPATVHANLGSLMVATDTGASEIPPPAAITNNPITDTIVFIIGLIPFAWATVEFWRRIAVGASFGTGQDSIVIIGEDGAPESSRGQRVLGKGALAVAYVLFGIAALAIGIAVYSVIVAPDVGVMGSSAPLAAL